MKEKKNERFFADNFSRVIAERWNVKKNQRASKFWQFLVKFFGRWVLWKVVDYYLNNTFFVLGDFDFSSGLIELFETLPSAIISSESSIIIERGKNHTTKFYKLCWLKNYPWNSEGYITYTSITSIIYIIKYDICNRMFYICSRLHNDMM